MLRRLRAKDGVRITYYEFGAASAETHHKANVLFSHATGFHGRVFDSSIKYLGSSYKCFSIDHRGHGLSGWNGAEPLHWDAFASDLLEVAHACCGTEKVVGVGHSMGAAALLMAALIEPDKFSALVLYEPIIFPLEMRLFFALRAEAPLAKLAKKRRIEFSSHEEAISNFSRKPPMKSFDTNVLKDFVEFGLAPRGELLSSEIDGLDLASDAEKIDYYQSYQNEGSIYLRCVREIEAEVYNAARHHTTWNDLHKISVPSLILAGKYDIQQPSFFAERLARKIPGSRFVRWDDNSHFGPLENPRGFADCVESMLPLLSKKSR